MEQQSFTRKEALKIICDSGRSKLVGILILVNGLAFEKDPEAGFSYGIKKCMMKRKDGTYYIGDRIYNPNA